MYMKDKLMFLDSLSLTLRDYWTIKDILEKYKFYSSYNSDKKIVVWRYKIGNMKMFSFGEIFTNILSAEEQEKMIFYMDLFE